jgi:hypothetical protein
MNHRLIWWVAIPVVIIVVVAGAAIFLASPAPPAQPPHGPIATWTPAPSPTAGWYAPVQKLLQAD